MTLTAPSSLIKLFLNFSASPVLYPYETRGRQPLRVRGCSIRTRERTAPIRVSVVCTWSTAHLATSGAVEPGLRRLYRCCYLGQLTQALLRPSSFLYPVTFTSVTQTSRTSVALKGMALVTYQLYSLLQPGRLRGSRVRERRVQVYTTAFSPLAIFTVKVNATRWKPVDTANALAPAMFGHI